MKSLKHIISWSTGAACYIAMTLVLMGYDNKEMHPAINAPIVDAFIENCLHAFNKPEEFKQYHMVLNGSHTYTGPGILHAGYFAATTTVSDLTKTPTEWIVLGGTYADIPEVPAALRHFYDPLGIDNGKKYLSNRGTNWEWIVNNNAFNPHITAKDWALTSPDNQWTFAKGKEWMKKALAEPDETRRDGYLAHAWRCLGETLHLVADMGCPVHVRNDSHAAPVGWTYRRALGDPDPYEELVKKAYASKYAKGGVDPALKSACRASHKADDIFDALATFTNKNFFSNQTIAGKGVKEFAPIINDRPAYPSPKLEQLEYDALDFAFYKTFPGGQKVKMCKDRSYFFFRGQPYIDKDCIESQASALIPNIVEAGANVMRLFIPYIKVELAEAGTDGKVKGSVKHITTQEYTSAATCRGAIHILVGNTLVGEGELKPDGTFELEGVNLKKDDEVIAEYNLGGIYVRSEPVKAGDEGLLAQLHACKTVKVDMLGDFNYSDGKVRHESHTFGWSYLEEGIGLEPITWSGASFTFFNNFANSTLHTNWTITGTMSSDGRTVKSLHVQLNDNWDEGVSIETTELQAVDLALDPNYSYVPVGDFNFGYYSLDPGTYIKKFTCNWDKHDDKGNPYSYHCTGIASDKIEIYVSFYK